MMIRRCVSSLCVVICGFAFTVTSFAQEYPEADSARALALLKAGKYQEATKAGGIRGSRSAGQLLVEISEAHRQREVRRMLALSDYYLDYYPFEPAGDWQRYGEILIANVLHRDARDGVMSAELTSEKEAANLYQNIVFSKDEYLGVLRWDLVQRLFKKYPASRFCAPALHLMASSEKDESRRNEEILKAVGQFDQNNVPLRRAIQVRIAALQHSASGLARLAEDIANMSDIPFEREHFLFQAAQSYVDLDDQLRCYRAYIDRFPKGKNFFYAVGFWASCHIRKHSADETLLETRKLIATRPGQDLSRALFAVSTHHFNKGEYERSLALLQEIHDTFPNSVIRARAQLGIGEVYEKLGDEDAMVAAYKAVIDMPREETQFGVMDSGDTHNVAIERLGNHYLKKRDFAESLVYWKRWQPGSWCGTCLAQMEDRKRRMMALCHLHLKQPQAAFELLKKVESRLDYWVISDLMLVVMHQRSGQLDELVAWAALESAKAKQILGQDPDDVWKYKYDLKRVVRIQKAIRNIREGGIELALDKLDRTWQDPRDYQKTIDEYWSWPGIEFDSFATGAPAPPPRVGPSDGEDDVATVPPIVDFSASSESPAYSAERENQLVSRLLILLGVTLYLLARQIRARAITVRQSTNEPLPAVDADTNPRHLVPPPVHRNVTTDAEA